MVLDCQLPPGNPKFTPGCLMSLKASLRWPGLWEMWGNALSSLTDSPRVPPPSCTLLVGASPHHPQDRAGGLFNLLRTTPAWLYCCQTKIPNFHRQAFMEKYISMLVKDSGFKTMVKLTLKNFPKFLQTQPSLRLPPALAFSALDLLGFPKFFKVLLKCPFFSPFTHLGASSQTLWPSHIMKVP